AGHFPFKGRALRHLKERRQPIRKIRPHMCGSCFEPGTDIELLERPEHRALVRGQGCCLMPAAIALGTEFVHRTGPFQYGRAEHESTGCVIAYKPCEVRAAARCCV